MKKIINGKLYDTATATLIGSDQYSNPGDFDYWCEILYRKKNGEYFLCGEGGARSQYSRQTGLNEWSGGETIIPMDVIEAKEWAESHLDADAYINAFGAPSE